MPAAQNEKARDGDRNQGEHGDAAKAGQVTRHFLDPERADRVSRIGCSSESQHDGVVKGARIAF